jgi:DNA-binding transcriptional LysR family regulator
MTTGKLARWPLKRGRKDLDIALPQSAVASTIEPLIYMAEQGLGIASLPDFAIQEQLATGRLVILLADHVHNAGTIRVLWPSSRHLSPKLRVFVDFMAQNLFAAARQ